MDMREKLLADVGAEVCNLVSYEPRASYNIFRVLEVQDKEVIMCRFLADLLDPNGEHGFGISFLKPFCENVIGVKGQEDALLKHTFVQKEYRIDDYRRIDIVIMNQRHFIPIEVKIYAEEQKGQCADYYACAVKHDPAAKIVYLTRFGNMPSEYSRAGLVEDKIICIGWERDVIPWLTAAVQTLNHVNAIMVNQFIDAVHEIADEGGLRAMEKTVNMICSSSDSLQAALQIEKSMKDAKWRILKNTLDEFKNQMESYCGEYNLVLEDTAHYCSYENAACKKYYDCYSTYPGINYVVKNVKFSNPNLRMWFRIEVEWNLFAGFVLYDMAAAQIAESAVGNKLSQIPDEIYEEAGTFLNGNKNLRKGDWWLSIFYSNGVDAEKAADYRDVPNFKKMNPCAVSLADTQYRQEYVRKALKHFETTLLSQLS